MSIATQITRITGLRNRIRTKLISLGVISDTSADLEDCTEAIEGMSGAGNTTIYKRSVNYTGTTQGSDSISFNVSSFITNINQIVFARVMSNDHLYVMETDDPIRCWVFEAFPNMTPIHSYSYGTDLFHYTDQHGATYYNAGIDITFSNGILTFTRSQPDSVKMFMGDFELEVFYTQNSNQVGIVDLNQKEKIDIERESQS